MKIAVRVETSAVMATIQLIGRGSGVISLYRKVLKNWFSTAQASCPANPSNNRADQMGFESRFF